MKEISFHTLYQIRCILEKGWSEDTTYEKDEYRKQGNRSFGQCYVTARTVNHILGWEILHYVKRNEKINHYWNRLPDGQEIDFTSDQFNGGDGIHKMEGFTGKPSSFKPINECKGIKPELRKYLKIVEAPLRKLKEELQ